MDRQSDKLIENDLIEPTALNLNSPIVLVPKKSEGKGEKYRLYIDYRAINRELIADKFPLQRTHKKLEGLGKAEFFSVLDLYAGLHQIPIVSEFRD